MAHEMMDVVRLELVQDGYGNGAVCERGKERDGPLRAVLAA